MQHQNSVLHDLLELVSWAVLDRLVSTHFTIGRHDDRRPRTCLWLYYRQVSGACELREIVGGVEKHAAPLPHFGSRPVRRSPLADVNAL